MHSDYAQDLNMLSTRLINLTSRILNFTSKFTDEGKIKLSEEDVEDDFHTKIVDDMDHLLERADIALDDLLGRNKAPAIAVKNVPNYQPKVAYSLTLTPHCKLIPTVSTDQLFSSWTTGSCLDSCVANP